MTIVMCLLYRLNGLICEDDSSEQLGLYWERPKHYQTTFNSHKQTLPSLSTHVCRQIFTHQKCTSYPLSHSLSLSPEYQSKGLDALQTLHSQLQILVHLHTFTCCTVHVMLSSQFKIIGRMLVINSRWVCQQSSCALVSMFTIPHIATQQWYRPPRSIHMRNQQNTTCYNFNTKIPRTIIANVFIFLIVTRY